MPSLKYVILFWIDYIICFLHNHFWPPEMISQPPWGFGTFGLRIIASVNSLIQKISLRSINNFNFFFLWTQYEIALLSWGLMNTWAIQNRFSFKGTDPENLQWWVEFRLHAVFSVPVIMTASHDVSLCQDDFSRKSWIVYFSNNGCFLRSLRVINPS